MDSAFSRFGFLIFGISISFYAFIVQSQEQNGKNGAESGSPAFRVSSPPPPPPQSSADTLSATPPPGTPPPLTNKMGAPPPPHRYIRNRRHHRLHAPPPPPPKMNAGKKVGLLFAGIAVIMQVGMVGFLVVKRRQLLKSDEDRYENCS